MAALAALLLLGGCAALGAPHRDPHPAVSLAEMGWLLGQWRVTGEGDGEATYEGVQVRDDSTFAVVHFTDSTRTTSRPDTGRIEERGGRVFHAYGGARWVAVGGTAMDLRLDPVSGTGVRLRWTRVVTTRRTTTQTRVDGLGRPVTRTLSLRRLDVDHSRFHPAAVPPR